MCAREETDGPHAHYLAETDLASKVDSRESHDLTEKTVKSQASERPEPGGLASYREFARTLIEIGLIEPVELGKIAVQCPKEVLGLSRVLVKAGKLTPYQAAAVYQKKSRGLLIGDYLILDKVGQGGMGKVFKARHRKLGRLGAIKILPPSFSRDRDAVMRFRREFEAAGRLKHINLVAAFEANEDRGVHFLVMEYVEGMNLDRVVSEQGPLPVPRGVDYLIQAARGLEASHGMGIIHRDIKPGNLMLDDVGTVRVLDLGLARIVDANNPFSKTATGRLTQSGMYMGTIDYMAPEQAEDPHSVDHRADIYSLGCTLYFLLTGQVPFPGKTILKRLLAHQEHAAPSLLAIRPGVSPAIEAAYLKMMAKRPEERPASMSDVIALLQASQLATDTGMEKVASGSKRRPAPEACHERPLERASSAPIIDSAIFARGVEGDGMRIDRELNLRDLVMDVLPEAGVTGDPRAVHDELDTIFTDQEFNLRDLAKELREEAAPLAAPKPRPPHR
jgi:serine/threonine protein kinase